MAHSGRALDVDEVAFILIQDVTDYSDPNFAKKRAFWLRKEAGRPAWMVNNKRQKLEELQDLMSRLAAGSDCWHFLQQHNRFLAAEAERISGPFWRMDAPNEPPAWIHCVSVFRSVSVAIHGFQRNLTVEYKFVSNLTALPFKG